MIGTELYKIGREMFEKKIKEFNFYGCEDFKDKIEDLFLDRLDEVCDAVDDRECMIDSELENFNFEEARREQEANEELDRIFERNRDTMNDFNLTR